jgi:hypothetical protein
MVHNNLKVATKPRQHATTKIKNRQHGGFLLEII